MNTIERYKASMPLQTQFVTNADSSGDQIFTQIKRKGNVCLYTRTNPETQKVVGYEVIVTTVVKAGTVFAKNAPPIENDYESYPGKSSFGKKGWSCVSMDRADFRFNQECQNQTVIPDGDFTLQDFAKVNDLPVSSSTAQTITSLLQSKVVVYKGKKENVQVFSRS